MDRLKSSKESFSPLVCSIFSLGKATCESISAFEQTITSLVEDCLVQNFFITLESCYPEYCEKLKKLQSTYDKNIKITVITHYPENIDQTNSNFFDAFLFGDNIENIDTKAKNFRTQNLRVIKALIDRSDFCICNLDVTIFSDKIRKYVGQKPKVTLLDLSVSL